MKKLFLTAAFGFSLFVATGAPAQVVVRIGPPPPHPVEVVPARPVEHPGWVWVPGFHRWDGAHYVWEPGHYAEPPHPGARWVPGEWRHRGDGYVWVEGRWR